MINGQFTQKWQVFHHLIKLMLTSKFQAISYLDVFMILEDFEYIGHKLY